MEINRITNAVAYVDGGTMLGIAEEVNLPDIKAKLSEFKALGMVGQVELPSGIEKMEMKIKWNSISKTVARKLYNPFKFVQLQLRANVENYGSNGIQRQEALVVFVTIAPKNIKLGDFKQNDNVETESNFTVSAVKMMMGGETLLAFDALANIFFVAGENVLAQYKLNTGA